MNLSQLPELPELPGVSYVMPVLNEEAYLESAVRTILAQDYAGEKQIVLALGPSSDRSNAIAAKLADEDPRVLLVPNPERDIPIGLNLAIAASSHPVVIRVDAHSELTPDYTSCGIAALRREGAVNVGGVMRAAGATKVQRAIAASYNSPYGLGGGAYHGSGTAGPAESAYLGIFRREAIDAVGGYDPLILRGEDWELNLRIRRAGGLIWFEPALGVTYWPRASFTALARQFFATGAWRAVITRRYPSETPWRFYMPAMLIFGLVCSLVIATCQLFALFLGSPWSPWWSLVHLTPSLYLLAVLFASTRLPGLQGFPERWLGLRSLITMHLSWGVGFVFGVFGLRTVDTSRV